MQTSLEFSTLDRPLNQTASVLKMLIERPGVSERDTNYNGFRSRLTEIRKLGINLRTIKKNFVTEFGKKSTYNQHFLYDSDKVEATRIYNKINK